MSGSTSIELTVKPDEVWPVLVGLGRREWYYGLTPSGDFEPGSRIEWRDEGGELIEESEVVEVDLSRRIVLRSHFLFAPRYSAAEYHRVTWKVEPSDGGSKVLFMWDAEGPPRELFENQAHAYLKGLRLALDPKAQAEIARLPRIGEIEVRDVTAASVSDYQRFFDDEAFRDYPMWQDCYCMESHFAGTEEEGSTRTAADNRRDMSHLIQRGHVTALLAFEGDRPVGWCNYGEMTHLAGLAKRFKLEAADHDGVGSISCFVIASPYRGHGVASKLLAAAIDRLRKRGVRSVEAYPSKTNDSAQGNYRGPLEMYTRAGFVPYRELERHVVMRKELA